MGIKISHSGGSGLLSKLALLLFFALMTSASAEQFSIKCPWQGYYYVSFDTDVGRVVYESPAVSARKGRIDKTDGDKIYFHLFKVGEKNSDLVWDASQMKLTWLDSRRQYSP